MRAYLISSDPDERDLLISVLRHIGLDVASSSNLQRVMENWEQDWAEMIVLTSDHQIGLLDNVRLVRSTTRMPLIMLTNPIPEAEYVSLIQSGADLVLERPVAPRVLAAYAQLFMRRAEAVPTFVLPTLEAETITLDPSTRIVKVSGQESRHLTQLEFYLLYVLMTNYDQVLPTDAIVERVWGHSGKGDRELVRGLVSRLRRKVESDPQHPRFVHTIPGIGYCSGPQNLALTQISCLT